MSWKFGADAARGRAGRTIALAVIASTMAGALIGTTAAVAAPVRAAAPASIPALAPGSLPIGVPWQQRLEARWNADPSVPLPSTTRHITVTVPRALFDFDSPITAQLNGAHNSALTVSSVDRVARTVDVEVPDGYFGSPVGGPRPNGSPDYFLVLRSSRPTPAGVVLPPTEHASSYLSSGIIGIGFSVGGPGATDVSRVVDFAGAANYSSSVRYWVDSGPDLHVFAGDTVSLAGGLPLEAGATTALSSEWDVTTTVPAATVVDASGLSTAVTIPSEQALSPLLNHRMWLTTSGSLEGTSVQIGTRFVVDHRPSAGPGVTTRIAAADRYWGAIAFSRVLFPVAEHPGKDVTLALAAGDKFADALSAAAATAQAGGDLLLLPHTSFVDPAVVGVASEAQRVQVAEVRPVGGQQSIDPAMSYGIADQGGTNSIFTLDGPDRYAVSQRVAWAYFPEGSAATVFVATGENFPDALAAVPAAASQGAPVLLVPGSQQVVDQATIAAIRRLGAKKIVIVGGPVSVSPGIEAQLSSVAPSLERIGGADRFAVATAVNTRFFPTATEAFVATGSNFPDALTGGVLAASRHAPLLLVRPDCVPTAAHAALEHWGVARTTLLGGPASLGAGVMDLRACS
ncbi:cell wall-binding repeat-containing protein [Herbiconiux sp. 11R-BC]|uniref:cell wall-binding repeat-containing protein n=1 Tax=Herbiconiux sp. 11R-BC TaxID=3111637 RepID=UPI003C0FBB66